MDFPFVQTKDWHRRNRINGTINGRLVKEGESLNCIIILTGALMTSACIADLPTARFERSSLGSFRMSAIQSWFASRGPSTLGILLPLMDLFAGLGKNSLCVVHGGVVYVRLQYPEDVLSHVGLLEHFLRV